MNERDFTHRLHAASESPGERDSLGTVFPLVYRELKQIARRQLVKAPFESLDTTGLVHEAYLKMVDQDRSTAQDRAHFLAIAAMAMRQVLITAATRRTRLKRGAGARAEVLQDAPDDRGPGLEDLLEVHRALESLEAVDARLVRVVECRFFAGYTEEETAEALGVSLSTVQRDWRRARAWLQRYMSLGAGSADG